jgi:hypothetical protein
MPTLVHFKRRVASRLGSGALEAEARQTNASHAHRYPFE